MKLLTIFQVLACLVSIVYAQDALITNEGESQQHSNNWAVIISTSRFWFNYRHIANSLSMYRTVKRLGIPDSQIILMLSDDIACNPRNAFQGEVFNNAERQLDLYGDNVKVDYRGYEVTVENFIRLLTDRWPKEQPRSKRLLTDENSNIFIYLTGHGGDEFLKFQDAEEISSYDIADAFEQMYEKKRYNEIFFMIDTCQANTMYSKFYSPNIIACGSSALHESSYSHHSDTEIGVAVIDRFTYYTLEFLENITTTSKSSLEDLFDYYTFEKIHSNVGIRTDLFKKDPKDVLITDFFGNVQKAIIDEPSADFVYADYYDDDVDVNIDIQGDSAANDSVGESELNPVSQYAKFYKNNTDTTKTKNVIIISSNRNSQDIYSYALTATIIAISILAYKNF